MVTASKMYSTDVLSRFVSQQQTPFSHHLDKIAAG
jgi:hypothetical protein